jgi:hypothetical protein
MKVHENPFTFYLAVEYTACHVTNIAHCKVPVDVSV